MKRLPEAKKLVHEIGTRLAALPIANTPAVRNIRRDVSRQVLDSTPEVVMQTALLLLSEESGPQSFIAYELVSHHKQTFESLRVENLLELGAGINSWSSVDCFAMYLSGPTWLHNRISDEVIRTWASSEQLWWRRAALVSTVVLSRRGHVEDARRVLEICIRLAADREDLVVKALSWALRELSKKQPEQVRKFISTHRKILAARVIREVENKLTTGRKTPGK